VHLHNTGVKHYHHPVVGELTLSFNRLDLPVDHGLTILTYAAEPGSRSEEALKLLGSWSATAAPPSRRAPSSQPEASGTPSRRLPDFLPERSSTIDRCPAACAETS
jgi:MmyB-like transcription regulator ligand binding domain